MSTTIITRYNGFIAEPNKAGHYSCPTCYKLTKAAKAPTITCAHCGKQGPIFTAGAVAVSPAVVAAVVSATEFIITGLAYSNTIQVMNCPNCKFVGATVARGSYTALCSTCGASANVSYKNICNACLTNAPYKIQIAEYLCSNPAGRHSAGHNSGLTVAGKCTPHKCSYDCKKI